MPMLFSLSRSLLRFSPFPFRNYRFAVTAVRFHLTFLELAELGDRILSGGPSSASAVEAPAKATFKSLSNLAPTIWHQEPPPGQQSHLQANRAISSPTEPPPTQQSHIHTVSGLQHSFLLLSPPFVIFPELYLYLLGSLELGCGPAEANAGNCF